MTNQENTIEKQIELKAPVGKASKGRNTTKGFDMESVFHIKAMKPQTYFAYNWIPFPMDRTFDYSKEELTLVEFFLEESKTGTLLKVKESGFDKITASRRAKAFEMHTGGWEAQLQNIEKFLA